MNVFFLNVFVNHFPKTHILFPEMCAITRACAGTHPSKFTCAIYCTCKIIVYSLWRNFSLGIIYIHEISNIINYKILQKKYIAHQFPQINHFLSLLDMDILLCTSFHEQYICLKPTWNSWLIHRLLTLYSTTQSRTSLPAAFFVGPLVLLREKYPCNTIQGRRCKPTNAWRAKSAMIALTGGTAFLRFYQKILG